MHISTAVSAHLTSRAILSQPGFKPSKTLWVCSAEDNDNSKGHSASEARGQGAQVTDPGAPGATGGVVFLPRER